MLSVERGGDRGLARVTLWRAPVQNKRGQTGSSEAENSTEGKKALEPSPLSSDKKIPHCFCHSLLLPLPKVRAALPLQLPTADERGELQGPRP